MGKLTIWTLVLVGCVALVACGGDEGDGDQGTKPTPPAEGGPTETGGGNGETPAATPDVTMAFTKLQEAWKKGDYGAMYDALSASTQKSLDGLVESLRAQVKKVEEGAPMAAMAAPAAGALVKEQLGIGLEEFKSASTKELAAHLLGKLAGEKTEMHDAKVVDEKVDGEKATVTVETAEGAKEEVRMVQEDGSWKMDLDLNR
jgi:hypothetical protein